MKQRFLVVVAVTVMAAAGWALWVNACDQNKQTAGGKVSATAASAECAAHMKGATAAGAGECPYHAGMSATTASMQGHDGCTMKGASATTASANGCTMKGASATTASANGCTMKGAATTASMDGCSMHGAKTTAAVASSKGADGCCSMKGVSAATASNAHGGCDMRSAGMGSEMCQIGAGMLGAPSCASHMGHMTAAEMKKECDACAQMVECQTSLAANAAQTQVVPLKNGVMFVYSSDTRAHVRAIQNAVARRNDKLNALTGSGSAAKLCPECKNVRGAIASGKLVRETVNTEGGCLTLVTSSDPALVAKLRAMASNGNATSNRTKS